MGIRVVISGPTGAIGMALIKRCIRGKISVLAICHKGSERIPNIPQSPYIRVLEAELSELSSIDLRIKERYDVFYHLAWEGTTGEARDDMHLQNQNVRYALDAVELAHRLGCKTFIGAGSQAEYGRVEGQLSPETPVHPENGYGMAKLCAGQMSRVICERLQIKHIWVRILSVYGPYDGAASMVSSTIRTLLAGEHASFTPGEQRWDYLYSEDAARALCLLAENGISGRTYVLGSGRARPLKEYIMEIYRAVGEVNSKAGSIGIGDLSYGEKQVMHLEADLGQLVQDTGFKPQVSFEKGIRETLKSVYKSESGKSGK